MREIEIKVESHEKRLRKIEADLEMLPTITSFDDWATLTNRDRKILYALSKYELDGANTVQIAKDIQLNKPETSGRTIVLRRFYTIQKTSIRLKGFPLIVKVGKKWSLNFDDFTFDFKEALSTEIKEQKKP